MTVIDTVASPPVDAMRAAGVTGVVRYLSLPQGNTVWKRIFAPEYNTLRAAGFDVLLNWEYDAQDWLGGSAAGGQHAAEAVAQAKALGYPAGCAIAGSCDFNMTAAQWQSAGWLYAGKFAAVVRAAGYRAGVYGPWDVLGWCQQLGGFEMFWQAGMSTAWSGGRNAQLWPGAHLRQRGHLTIAGQDCDYNDVLQSNYGQAGGRMADDYTPLGTPPGIMLAAGGPPRTMATLVADLWAQEVAGHDPYRGVDKSQRTQQLQRIEDALTGLTTPTVTQDQVDSAVAKVMNDPTWIGQLAAAVAGHIHVA